MHKIRHFRFWLALAFVALTGFVVALVLARLAQGVFM